MNSRRRVRPAGINLASVLREPPALTLPPARSRTVSKEAYRDFHPVTSTLVILSSGISAFFVVFYLGVQVAKYLKL